MHGVEGHSFPFCSLCTFSPRATRPTGQQLLQLFSFRSKQKLGCALNASLSFHSLSLCSLPVCICMHMCIPSNFDIKLFSVTPGCFPVSYRQQIEKLCCGWEIACTKSSFHFICFPVFRGTIPYLIPVFVYSSTYINFARWWSEMKGNVSKLAVLQQSAWWEALSVLLPCV